MGKRRLAREPSSKGKRSTQAHWKTWVFLGILALALVGIVVYLVTQGPAGIAKVGRPAPDFTLYQLNGQKITLSGLRGRTVLVNFWGST